jgi:hypothetical protein
VFTFRKQRELLSKSKYRLSYGLNLINIKQLWQNRFQNAWPPFSKNLNFFPTQKKKKKKKKKHGRFPKSPKSTSKMVKHRKEIYSDEGLIVGVQCRSCSLDSSSGACGPRSRSGGHGWSLGFWILRNRVIFVIIFGGRVRRKKFPTNNAPI